MSHDWFQARVTFNHLSGYDNTTVTPVQKIKSYQTVDLHLGFDITEIARTGLSRLDAIAAMAHPDDAAQLMEGLGQSLATGRSFAMRHRLRRADGAYRWMSSRAEPMRDEDGKILQWYGLCHDIDDQVSAEEALRRSERQLQQMIDAVPALTAALCSASAGTRGSLTRSEASPSISRAAFEPQ